MSTHHKPARPSPTAPTQWRAATRAVREGLARSAYGEHSEALYLTSSFVHPDAQTAARRFVGEEDGFVYSRFSNPSVAMFEKRLAALEGAQAAIATASGMGAVLLLALGLLKSGDHLICSRSVFGATVKLLGEEMARLGIACSFVAQSDTAAWRAAMRPQTRLLFAETPSNPLTEICDIAALAEIAHQGGALLAVDNAFCTPALQLPLALGADFVIHSGTKYLDGQGRVLAGAICGSEEWINGRLTSLMRSVGISLSPFNAWVVLKGLETLGLRMRAHSASAAALAEFLQTHPAIERVLYPGLPSHPQHALAMLQQSRLGGGIVTFTLKTSEPEARAHAFDVINRLRLFSLTANLGDTKSTVTHPSSTTHARLSEEQRQSAGITQAMVRLSVGLEDVEDLREDLALALE